MTAPRFDARLPTAAVVRLLESAAADTDSAAEITDLLARLPATDAAAIQDAWGRLRATTSELRKRGHELSALFSSARELAQLRDVDALLERLVRRASDLIGTDLIYLSEFDPDTTQLRVRTTLGAVSTRFRQLRVPPGMGLASKVVETRSPQWAARYGELTTIPHEAGIDAVPNPFKVLSRKQVATTSVVAAVSSTTFVFSPVATTVLAGEIVGARIKHGWDRLTSVLAVKNGTTESTYLAETLIPLVAFGLPLSPVAAGPAAPLFNAPPVFSVDNGSGEVHNLHTLMSTWEFLVFGLVGVVLAAVVAYPLSMNFARAASLWVMRKVSHEALIGAFAGLIMVIAFFEGGFFGIGATVLIAAFAGLVNRQYGMNAGVQFMAYYTAILFVPAVFG